ncbi:hypothetical protein RUMCAL_01126 [Ruminococcus callidus ATCC 27760]|uniref:Uncharacterized protein n=1 Tax=Ruminococcus callidus ATCC 27760 TaxID=411473 RepID=U2KDB1_9FIRM|nr:hypothetical protein RUMCAL_01126 [Ruminococcus callidus ATCC 27760]
MQKNEFAAADKSAACFSILSHSVCVVNAFTEFLQNAGLSCGNTAYCVTEINFHDSLP